MATHTRRVGTKRPTRTKAERAAIAQRMRAYHAKRRAAKLDGTPTAKSATLKLEVTGSEDELRTVLQAVALLLTKGGH